MSEDRDLSKNDIQGLSSIEGVVSFFASLGYDTNARLPQTNAAMGITALNTGNSCKTKKSSHWWTPFLNLTCQILR